MLIAMHQHSRASLGTRGYQRINKRQAMGCIATNHKCSVGNCSIDGNNLGKEQPIIRERRLNFTRAGSQVV